MQSPRLISGCTLPAPSHTRQQASKYRAGNRYVAFCSGNYEMPMQGSAGAGLLIWRCTVMSERACFHQGRALPYECLRTAPRLARGYACRVHCKELAHPRQAWPKQAPGNGGHQPRWVWYLNVAGRILLSTTQPWCCTGSVPSPSSIEASPLTARVARHGTAWRRSQICQNGK